MKSFLLHLALLPIFISMSLGDIIAQDRHCMPVGNLSEEALAFKGGEKLVFAVHYKWGLINADVAKASLGVDTSVLNGRNVFHASFRVKTQKIYSSFFLVEEQLDSWFTRYGLQPMKFTRQAREGGYTCTNLYLYDWTPGNRHIKAALNTSRKGDFSAELPLDDCTFDLPLLYFMLRNINASTLAEGSRYPVTFAVDDDVHKLHFTYLGKETKKVPGLGSVRCMKLGFQVVPGEVFSDGSDLYMWISDDANKIPVLFEAPLKVGKVQGRLSEYSGLKHDFKSLNSK